MTRQDPFRRARRSDRSAPTLAQALARQAQVLRVAVEALLERDKGREEPSELTGFYRTLSSHLFQSLSEREFADLYAQTVAYGLLAARCWEDGDLDRRTLYERIPAASGILRDVFRYVCLSPPPEIETIFDGLVDLVRPGALKRSLQREFAERGDRDPILHFYETFLRHYDAKTRKNRGVYYTPPAVVSYVVRSVDFLLRTRLGRPDGLADPRVWFLDPAAGTTTFLVEAFRKAIETCGTKYGRAAVPALVRDHLLPHGFGFELMMAPYAIGHLKMSLFLVEQGYALRDEDRVNLLLTNALERDNPEQKILPGFSSLAREVNLAAEVKEDRRISVVIGNPPYSGRSENRTDAANLLLRESGYYQVDGEPLREKNAKWLQDDYVKFLRFAQRRIDESGEGVVGLVLNHSYLDNPTFRGLRRSLMNSFEEIYLLDLHGNRRRRETAPDGGVDDNVFEEVGRGISILLLVKKPGLARKVARYDLWGNRLKKLRWLAARDVGSTPWVDLDPPAPSYLFVGRDVRLEEAYARGIRLTDLFVERSVGVLTARDRLVIDFDREALRARIRELRNGMGDILKTVPDTGNWTRAEAVRRAAADEAWESRLTEILYRPFDYRSIFYADYLIERPRERIMRHLLGGSNRALVVPRQSKDGPGALVTDRIAAHKAVSAYDINSVFPLYLFSGEGRLDAGQRKPNVAPWIFAFLQSRFGEPVTPEAVFCYVYAVLYSEEYRDRYAAFLAADFPRIPFPESLRLFKLLAQLGAELVDLHLSRVPLPTTVQCLGTGGGRLSRSKRLLRGYKERERRVYVNEEGQYFEGISPRIWRYRVGGYPVLSRWLQDRAGRILTWEEYQAFFRAAAAIERTIVLQEKIDELVLELEEAA
ncbi:MAG TPA: type ISP restriction/modification enzyme [Thermoanaerobaculia bacterium]|jgi:predicted helicase|nr:type ISP restriction/modification enzyme [Thermoanaerobaculia bacterium]